MGIGPLFNRYSGRYIYIDALRIISAFLVIFNHTENRGFFLFSTRAPGAFYYWADLFVSVFCKCAVCVFFAISGAVLLGREPDDIGKYLRRIIRMIALLMLVSLVYYLNLIIPVGMRFDPKAFITMVYSSPVVVSLWFLYAYIAFLIVLPFLQMLVKNLNDTYVLVMVIVALLFNDIIPCAEFLVFRSNYSLYSELSPFIIVSIFLYPILGYYLHNCCLDRVKRKIPFLWIINVLCILIACVMVRVDSCVNNSLRGDDLQRFISAFVLINTITVFITFRTLIGDKRSEGRSFVCVVGASTLGVYLLHLLLLERKWLVIICDGLIRFGISEMVACFVWVLAVFALSSLVTVAFSLLGHFFSRKRLLKL